MELDISNICRCCLNYSNNLTDILSTVEIVESGQTTLLDMLVACASVNINKEETLPLTLCDNCISRLCNAYIFKSLCEKSESTLRELLRQNDEKTENYDIKPEVTILNTYSCCSKEFSNLKSFHKHQLTHTKKYICKICNKSFTSPNGLWYHEKRHLNGKAYSCSSCGKKFVERQGLRKHYATFHTKEKGNLCPTCGKAYSTNDALKYHMKSHLGADQQRPWLCIHCGKTFKQSCHLNTHMWIHNGIKPWNCELCDKRYTSSFQLKRHKVIHKENLKIT